MCKKNKIILVILLFLACIYISSNTFAIYKETKSKSLKLSISHPISTVSFNYRDGITESTSKSVVYGATYGSLPSPSRNGYTFEGWYQNFLGEPVVYGTSSITSTITTDDMFLIKKGTYILKLNIENATSWRPLIALKDLNGNNITENSSNPFSIGANYNSTYGTWVTSNNVTDTQFTIVIKEDCYARFFVGLGDVNDSATIDATLYMGNSEIITSLSKVNTPFDHTLYAKWVPNTYTATFYYNSNSTSGELTPSAVTAQCTISGDNDSCDIPIPDVVKNSVGKYNSINIGVSNEINSMTLSGSQVVTLNGDKSFYAIYSSPVSIHYPNASVSSDGVISNTSVGNYSYYRNEYFVSLAPLNISTNSVINSTQTSTSNFTFASGASNYSLYGFSTSASNYERIYNTIALAASSDSDSLYAILRKNVTATAYYNSGNNTVSVASTTTNAYRYMYCENDSTVTMYNDVFAIPSVVLSSKSMYGSTLYGYASELNSMSESRFSSTNETSFDADIKTLYAIYRGNKVNGELTHVTNYYYDGSQYTSRTLYRNSYFTSVSGSGTMSTVLSSSFTGTSNYSTASGPGGSSWTGLSTEQDTNAEYLSVADAASSSSLTLYTVYTMNINYLVGTDTVSIGKSSDNCKITTDNTSCSVILPSITSKTGYSPYGWRTTSTSASGTAVGSSYTITSSGTTLYGNSRKNRYKLIRIDGGENLVTNNDLENYSLINTQTFGSNHTWDEILNGVPTDSSKTYLPSGWNTGLNPGVVVPEIGYHAHMRVIDNNAVFRFKTNEEYEGNTGSSVPGGTYTPGTITTNRWLGVKQTINGAKLTAGKKYAISMDIYRVSGTTYVNTGLYHITSDSSSYEFYSGRRSLRPSTNGKWERKTYVFTLSSNYTYTNTSNPVLYIYGYNGGSGELLVDNITLEEVTEINKNYGSKYTNSGSNSELSSPTVTRDGYTYVGWYPSGDSTTRLSDSYFNVDTATFEDIGKYDSYAFIYARWGSLKGKSPGIYDYYYNKLYSWEEAEQIGLTKEAIETDYANHDESAVAGIINNIVDQQGSGIRIVFPDTITKIGDYAFENTGVVELKLSDSITTIGKYAFSGTEITKLEIPSNVETIWNGAFRLCHKLKTIDVKGNGSTVIKPYAFGSDDVLETVTIGDGVTTLENDVFWLSDNLKYLYIGKDVSSVTGRTLATTKLENVIVDTNNTTYDSRNNSNAIIHTATNTLVSGTMNTTIPNTVTSIGSYAFYQRRITEITIPSSVTTIDSNAFSTNSALTKVILPEGLTTIGENAFASDTGLTEITIPGSVTLIYRNAFKSDTNLANVTFTNPNNWRATSSATATSGTSLTLTNTAQNAKYLKTTYVTKYFRRIS